MDNATQTKTVIIYSTPTCTYCKQAKEFFKEHNVSFENKDVTQDLAARRDMIEKSHQMGVPVIVVGDEVIVGFNEPKLRTALAL